MADATVLSAPAITTDVVTKEKMIDLLNQDLEREFQAVIAYVNSRRCSRALLT